MWLGLKRQFSANAPSNSQEEELMAACEKRDSWQI